jgi:transcriptional regulator with XRE-family HTH domain
VAPISPDRDESQVALGRVVRQVRVERKLTQEALAQRADLHETYISFIESGRRNPTWGAIRKISYGLGIPLPELIRKVEELEREG